MTEFSRQMFGFRFVEVRIGDTLQQIAARELGDAGRWYDLISYNTLVPPFIVGSPSAPPRPGVLVPGDLIIVPAPAPAASRPDPESVFGSDIDLTGGQLTAENGDFAVISGRANFRQALKHRIDTERGELMFHLDYGSQVRRMLGAINGPAAGQIVAEYARAAVAGDPRVRRILRAEAEVTGDAVRVTVYVEPVAGESLEIAANP
jgi:Phage baseplate assembly protein W